MKCKKCGWDTYVVDSRPKDSIVQRRRSCPNCGERFSTIEIDRDVYDGMTRGWATSLRMDVVTYPDGRPPIVNYYKL